VSIILIREGTDTKTRTNFYKVIVQSTLLYDSDTWTLTKQDFTPLTMFHNKVARHISHCHIQKLPQMDIWVYPDMHQVLQELNFTPLLTYIEKRNQLDLNGHKIGTYSSIPNILKIHKEENNYFGDQHTIKKQNELYYKNNVA
jgi:hypothetical protein